MDILDIRLERRAIVNEEELGLEEAGDGIKVGCGVAGDEILQSDGKFKLTSDTLSVTCSSTI